MSIDSKFTIKDEIESHAPPKAIGPAPAHALTARAIPQALTTQAPVQVALRPLIERLCKYGAYEFKGKKDDDSTTAEYWLESIERII
ncbi:hypothetical protein JCGZ_13474 [Jatropha curcas]|uniref:Uncharacterized protein n=1 Tax=Jatropha curcas TaxID=180498 RepID=A0A067LFJ6_JATCU|nr:hypothetical protein JCGZ_13474 [Jatropha curcas]